MFYRWTTIGADLSWWLALLAHPKAQIQTGQLLSFDDVFDVLSLCRLGPRWDRDQSFAAAPWQTLRVHCKWIWYLIWMMLNHSLNRIVLPIHLVSFKVAHKSKQGFRRLWHDCEHSAKDLHIPNPRWTTVPSFCAIIVPLAKNNW